MPMIGARFYTQLDAAMLRCDVIENELAKVTLKEVRLFELVLGKFSWKNSLSAWYEKIIMWLPLRMYEFH